jgi:hypothetical protein
VGPFHIARFLKLLAAAATGIVTGVWLLAHPGPGVGDAPPAAADYMAGVGVLAVGLILLAFAAWVAFRRPSR